MTVPAPVTVVVPEVGVAFPDHVAVPDLLVSVAPLAKVREFANARLPPVKTSSA